MRRKGRNFYLLIISIVFILGTAHCQTNNRKYLLNQIVQITLQNHTQPKDLNDSLSVEVFETFFLDLDPEQLIFTETEINSLSTFKYKLDDELINGDTDFFEETVAVYHKQLKKLKSTIDSLFQSPISVKKEVYEYFNDIPVFPSNQQDLINKWNNNIQLNFYKSVYNVEKNKLPENSDLKSMQLENERRNANWLKTHLDKTDEQLFIIYINSYLKVNDRQSAFLSKEAKRKWDADFNRSYVGIGISLEIDNNQPKIVEIIPGASAWEDGTLKTGDILISIKNKEDKWVDTYGLELNNTISLLLGEKKSWVEIQAISSDGNEKTLSLERKEIPTERLTKIVFTDSKNKYAYLKLPRFYVGDKTSSEDMLEALNEINSAGIENLIFDIRNNQGGSAREAITIIGYFLEGGRIMQSNYDATDGRPYYDPDSTGQFEGNLLVLVNSKSSSASELLSGSLQDYDRAIIVGSIATYGKGTSQRFFTVDSEDGQENLGDLKLTIGKFYTAAGRSAQYKGIKPDIVFPDQYSFENSGERVGRNQLRIADLERIEIPKQSNCIKNKKSLISKSHKRISENPYFLLQDSRRQQKEAAIGQIVEYINFKDFQKVKNLELEMNFMAPEPALANDSFPFSTNSRMAENDEYNPDWYIKESLLILRDIQDSN